MSYKIAIVGATGNVGREVLNTLAERNFPASEVVALASERSMGHEVSFGEDQVLKVEQLETYDFTGTDFAFFCTGAKVSEKYVPIAAATGCVVIDESSHFRLQSGIPLVVPEVNAHALHDERARNIIASPNCIATPLALALKPLQEIAPLKRVVVSTYQSVSGAGQKAMDELFNQTRAIFMNTETKPEEFTKPIAFNLIPHIDNFDKDGITGEEEKAIQETQKLLEDPVDIFATCVRVPVFIGHSISINVEFEDDVTVDQARKAYSFENGVAVVDVPENDAYATPAEIAGEDLIAVSRIRKDTTVPHGLALWVVSDNLRKGAALNAVQIAENLINQESQTLQEGATRH